LFGQYFVYQQGRSFGHVTSTKARAEPSSFAAENNQVLGMAGLAAHPTIIVKLQRPDSCAIAMNCGQLEAARKERPVWCCFARGSNSCPDISFKSC
jgi:hypothetical protein